MAADFGRTRAALAAEGLGRHAVLLALAAGLVGGWAVWLGAAPLAVQVESDHARIEVEARVHPVHVDLAGRVRVSHLELGRDVHRGDVLLELDREDPELALQEAEARLAANRAVLDRMDALADAERTLLAQLVAAGEVAVDETTARARRAAIAAELSAVDAARWAELREQGAAAEMDAVRSRAEADGEQALARAETLASRRMAADQTSGAQLRQVEIEQLRVEMAELEVAIATDEVAIRKLRSDLDHRTVRAPADGRLGWIASVSAELLVAAGQHVATVVPAGRLQIVALFPAREAVGRVRPGQRAALRLDAFPRTAWGQLGGRITRVGTEPKDGRVRVEAELDDRGSAGTPQVHGLEGTLSVTVERATPLQLLLRAVGRRDP